MNLKSISCILFLYAHTCNSMHTNAHELALTFELMQQLPPGIQLIIADYYFNTENEWYSIPGSTTRYHIERNIPQEKHTADPWLYTSWWNGLHYQDPTTGNQHKLHVYAASNTFELPYIDSVDKPISVAGPNASGTAIVHDQLIDLTAKHWHFPCNWKFASQKIPSPSEYIACLHPTEKRFISFCSHGGIYQHAHTGDTIIKTVLKEPGTRQARPASICYGPDNTLLIRKKNKLHVYDYETKTYRNTQHINDYFNGASMKPLVIPDDIGTLWNNCKATMAAHKTTYRTRPWDQLKACNEQFEACTTQIGDMQQSRRHRDWILIKLSLSFFMQKNTSPLEDQLNTYYALCHLPSQQTYLIANYHSCLNDNALYWHEQTHNLIKRKIIKNPRSGNPKQLQRDTVQLLEHSDKLPRLKALMLASMAHILNHTQTPDEHSTALAQKILHTVQLRNNNPRSMTLETLTNKQKYAVLFKSGPAFSQLAAKTDKR